MRKNEGFSLIELVVTVAIMAVLAAGTVTVFLSQSGTRCRKAAELLNSELAETKSQALSKQGVWVALSYHTGDGYVLTKSFASDIQVDSSGNVKPVSFASGEMLGDDFEITYDVYDMHDQLVSTVTLDENCAPLVISYDRASGALKGTISASSLKFKSEDVVKSDGTHGLITGYEMASDATYCKRITIAKGSRYVYKIEFDRVTGKHTLIK